MSKTIYVTNHRGIAYSNAIRMETYDGNVRCAIMQEKTIELFKPIHLAGVIKSVRCAIA